MRKPRRRPSLAKDVKPPSSPPPPAARRDPARATLTSLPPELLRLIFLHLLETPSQSPILCPRALENSEPAFALASTCTLLRNVFRTSAVALDIAWNTPVYLHTLASLLGPSLRALTIRSHAHAETFLNTLCAHPAAPSLRALTLSNCAAPRAALETLARRAPPLRELRLVHVHADLSALLRALAPHLARLRVLHVRGASTLSHAALLAACAAAGPALRDLALRYARHPSVTGPTLAAVAAACPRLTHLFLDDVRHAPPPAVAAVCTAYGPRLRALRLHACRLAPRALREVLRACGGVLELALEDPAWSAAQTESVVEAVAECCPGVRELHLRDVRGVLDADVRRLVEALPRLERLALRRQEFVTDAALRHVCRLGAQLTSLDVRGCFVTDDGLEALGEACTRLQVMRLGGDGQDLSEHGAQRVAADAVSNEGLDVLLAGCGATLREFTWETPRCLKRSPAGREFRALVGVERLHAKGLARSLAARCPNLRRVEVNGLRPPARERVERARCDLAFIELEEAVRHVVVLVDSEQPF